MRLKAALKCAAVVVARGSRNSRGRPHGASFEGHTHSPARLLRVGSKQKDYLEAGAKWIGQFVYGNQFVYCSQYGYGGPVCLSRLSTIASEWRGLAFVIMLLLMDDNWALQPHRRPKVAPTFHLLFSGSGDGRSSCRGGLSRASAGPPAPG